MKLNEVFVGCQHLYSLYQWPCAKTPGEVVSYQDDIPVCSVVKAEIHYGAMKSQTPAVSLQKQQYFLDQFNSLPFDDTTVPYYGTIRAALEKLGTPLAIPTYRLPRLHYNTI